MSSILAKSASIEHASTGLDRASFNVYDKADRHIIAPIKENAPSPSSSDSDGDDNDGDQEEANTSPRSFANVRRVSAKVKSKVKTQTHKILHTSHQQHAPQLPTTPALAPAPIHDGDHDRLFHPVQEHKGPRVKDVLHHPVDTVSSLLSGASGAKMAAVMDNQVIAHGADVNLVRVSDKVTEAGNEEDKQSALAELEDLKKARQDQYVRWTMDRHVLKVRRIPPLNIKRPQKKDFKMEDQKEEGQIDWATYSQHLVHFYARYYGDQYIDDSSALPWANEDAINTSLERFLMTSTPYQVVLMKIRHIYRWDDPLETGVYLGSYLFLWAIGHLAGAAVLGMMWLVLRRHFYPPTAEDLRENIKRSEDTEQTATNLTQLIEQHGSRGWFEALIKKLGPRSLLALADMADTLEIMRNFYEWRRPHRTILSLSILGLVWLSVTMTPLWLLVKMTQLEAALMFFGTFPIASRMPQYRHVVSPLTWLFWKIPTDAEWAIARLQVEARHSKDAVSQKPNQEDGSSSDKEEKSSKADEETECAVEIGRYHCTCQSHHGEVEVSSSGARYVTAVRSNMLWNFRYDNCKTIRKQSDSGLIFELMDGTEYKVMGLVHRNEIFTQIIGYSGLAWQVTG